MLDRARNIYYIARMKKLKRPKDTNQLAKSIVDLAVGETTEILPKDNKNIHAVELGRLGGLKGGKARAKKLSKAKRIEIAKQGAKARWQK
jgi:hypothetical protein